MKGKRGKGKSVQVRKEVGREKNEDKKRKNERRRKMEEKKRRGGGNEGREKVGA